MAGEVDYIATLTIHHPDGDIVIACQSMEGGDVDPEKGTSRNAVTGKTRARGGLAEMTDVSIAAEIDLRLWQLMDRIDDSAGKDRYTAIKQMVGPRREVRAFSTPWKRTGVLGTPAWGGFDINGGDNTSMLEIESGCDQP